MKKNDCNDCDELRQTLFGELRSLRQTVREAGEGFILRKEGEIEALLSYLAEMKPSQVEKFGKAWLRESRDMSIKPTKGRIKDLRRIDALLEDLLSRVIEVDGATIELHNRSKVPTKKQEKKGAITADASGEL